MQWNSETDSNDIVSDAKFWCGILSSDSTSYSLDDMSRVANKALDKCHMLILQADALWEHQDANDDSSPLLDTSTALVSGTRRYAIPLTWLKIARVRCKDSAGNYITLAPAKRKGWSNTQLNASSGTPQEYSPLGSWIELDKAPNYSVSAGLEVQYQVGPSYFDGDTDTTKTPGFVAPFHSLISLEVALEYCEVNDLDSRAAKIRNRLGMPPTTDDAGSGLYKAFSDFYSGRNVDMRPNVSPPREDYGQGILV